jgi:hypothetical protein
LKAAFQALRILIRRHIADGHPNQARPVASEAIQAYRQIAATPGANAAAVTSNLITLSGELSAPPTSTPNPPPPQRPSPTCRTEVRGR